jgi:hypothetical protein
MPSFFFSFRVHPNLSAPLPGRARHMAVYRGFSDLRSSTPGYDSGHRDAVPAAVVRTGQMGDSLDRGHG